LDGHLDEVQWSHATVESHFVFPWQERTAPGTDFRALCDDDYFYFAFRVVDADLFVLADLPEEGYAVFEDRVEMYFARDDWMQDYYCIEIDPHGRTMDYSGSYYRQFDLNWRCPGLETHGAMLDKESVSACFAQSSATTAAADPLSKKTAFTTWAAA
jgi:hypothetical protein